MQANNASISPQDLFEAAHVIVSGMDEMGQRYVRIANDGLELAANGLQGSAGNSLATKLNELRQQGERQSQRSAQVAQNMKAYAGELGEQSAAAAAAFAGL